MTERKRVLVSGVSRGLGLEIARTLLEHDYHVLGICREPAEGLRALQEEYGGAIEVLRFDLGLTGEMKRVVFDQFVGHDEALWGMVNNAAVAYDDLITNFQAEAVDAMFRVNLIAPIMLCREAIRHMLYHRTQGRFVHISSVCAHTGYKGLAAYAATKGGLEAFSRTLAREWGSRGLRSNCVAAGFMATDMSSGLGDEARGVVMRRSALQSLADPASVAATVRFLLSEEAASITGETLGVDAGAR